MELQQIRVNSMFFMLTLLFASASLVFPWHFDTRWRRVWLHLPLLAFASFVLYELGVPPDANIRVDLLILIPAVLVAALVYLVKLARWTRGGAHSSNPERAGDAPEPGPDQRRSR